MESLGRFRSFPAIEEVAAALILLCAALYCQKKSEVESRMGMGFQPSNETIFRLLDKKRFDPNFLHHAIKDIDDICSLEPWDLARVSNSESEDQVWYFFNEPCYKYKKSNRAHRRTTAGYWKVTGRGSKIKAKNGLTGDKKILTFHRHGPVTKEAKTEWVMHEYHIKDNPSYKREFVFCRIERKRDKKLDISTSDEGESSQLLVSPTDQLSPNNQFISYRSHSEENILASPQLPPNHNMFSYPGNPSEQNSSIYPQLPNHESIPPTQLSQIDHLISERNLSEENNLYSLTNPPLVPKHNLISLTQLLPSDHLISERNRSEENIFTNPQPLPNNHLIPYLGSPIQQNTLSNMQLLPNHSSISYSRTYQNTITNPQLPLPNDNMISYSRNDIDQNTLTNQQLNYNFISHSENQIEENTPTYHQLQPNQNPISHSENHIEESSLTNPGLSPNMVMYNVAETSYQEGQPLLEDFNSFSEMQNFIDYFDLVNGQIDSEQVSYLINSLGALQNENSCEDTGQALTPDLNSSKSDGGTYAEDCSDTNTEMIDAWVNELLEINS